MPMFSWSLKVSHVNNTDNCIDDNGCCCCQNKKGEKMLQKLDHLIVLDIKFTVEGK